jgi:AMP-polyphosphate phosphotransferase
MSGKPQAVALREALLDAQFELRKQPRCGVLVIVTGFPAAGRSEVVNDLRGGLDPKFVDVHAFAVKRPDARERPFMWQFWRSLPRRGRVAFFFDAWYGEYFQARIDGKTKRRDLVRMAQRICKTESTLARNGIRILKVHLEVDTVMQKTRLTKLRADKLTSWRVSKEDLWRSKHYSRVSRAMRSCLRLTDDPVARWHIIDAKDEQKRLREVGRLLIHEINTVLGQSRTVEREAWVRPKATTLTAFPARHRGKILSADDYDHELERLQSRFANLTRGKHFRKQGLVLAFEGMDAAGKGGAIERVTEALDARQYRVVPIGAPTPEEFSYPYLWRFWQSIPARGDVVVFDRTWYGRVLVERVRRLTPEADWRRAYAEIREFELELVERGFVVLKFWLSLGYAEQLKRFQERDSNPLKRFKVDPEDWTNRRHFAEYQIAAKQMVARTNESHAPWTIVEADDKQFARLKVLRTVCEALQR